MDIQSYMSAQGMTQAEFAKKTGFTQAMISQWLAKRRAISAKAAMQIEKRTGGEISRRDLRPDLWGKAA